MELPLDILFRWMHVGTAIVVLGGSVFMRFVLMPAAAELPDAEHDALRQRIIGRWRKFVGLGIALFLVSGIYNLTRALPRHSGDSLYHMLFGIKFLLALVVFFLASALTGRSPKLQPIRDNAKKWLGLTVLAAALVVGISGIMKVRPNPVAAGSSQPPPAPDHAQ